MNEFLKGILSNKKVVKTVPLFDQALVSGSNFLIGILLVRSLGEDIYGQYSLLWLLVVFFDSIHQAMIIAPMLSIGPKYGNDRKKYDAALLYHQIVYSIASVILGFVFIKSISYFKPAWEVGPIGLVAVFAIGIFTFHNFFRRYFFSTQKPIIGLLLDGIAFGGHLIALLALFFFEKINIELAYLIVLTTYGLSSIIGIVLLPNKTFELADVKKLWFKHFDFSKWLVTSALLQFFSGNYFVICGGIILGTWVVGVIKIIQNLMGVLHVFFLALENFVPSNAAALLKEKGMPVMLSYLKKITVYVTFILIAVGLVLSIFKEELIGLVYGQEYEKYSYLLIWYTGIYFLNFIVLMLRYYFRTVEITKPIFIAYVIGSAFSLLAANYFVQSFDIMGIVYGSMLFQIITIAYYTWSTKREKGVAY